MVYMNCLNCQSLLILAKLSIINCFTCPIVRFFSTNLFNFNCLNNQLGIAGLMGYDTSTASTAQCNIFWRGVYVSCFNCQKLLFLQIILIINCFNCLTVHFFLWVSYAKTAQLSYFLHVGKLSTASTAYIPKQLVVLTTANNCFLFLKILLCILYQLLQLPTYLTEDK